MPGIQFNIDVTDYYVHIVLINHSTNELLTCMVPVGGAYKTGLQAYCHLPGTRVMELTIMRPELRMSVKATGDAFQFSACSLAIPLWERRCGQARAPMQLR